MSRPSLKATRRLEVGRLLWYVWIKGVQTGEMRGTYSSSPLALSGNAANSGGHKP